MATPTLPAPVQSHKDSYELPDPVVTVPPIQSFADLSVYEMRELKKMILPFTVALTPQFVNQPDAMTLDPEFRDLLLKHADIKRRLHLTKEQIAIRNHRENFTRSLASLFASTGKYLEVDYATERYKVVYLEIKSAGKEILATIHRPGAGDTDETFVFAAVHHPKLEFSNHIYRHRAEQGQLIIRNRAWKATHPLPAKQTLVGLAARCLANNWSRFKPASQVAILARLGISQDLTVDQTKMLDAEEVRAMKEERREKKKQGSPKREKKEAARAELKNQGVKRKRGEEEEEEAVDDDMSDFEDPRELEGNRRLVRRRLFVDLVSEDEEGGEEDEKAEKKE